jgi:hypothetical protein
MSPELLQLLLPLVALTVVPIARASMIMLLGLVSVLSRDPQRRKEAQATLRQLLRRTDGAGQ